MSKKHIQPEIVIPCFDTDAAWRLKPVSFMNMAQEAANAHATVLGFGYDDLVASRTAWVLSRMRVEFINTPKWRDKVTFQTWHKGLDRLFYLRDFILTDRQGNPMVKATSSWLVLNLETRRLVRDPKLMDEGTTCSENVLDTPADKVQFPKEVEMECVMEHVVAYSDVDMLGHANNAMYMQWTMDAIDYEIVSQRPIKAFTINFNHEVKAGEIVSLFRACQEKEDGLHVYVEGKTESASSFSVEAIF